MDSRFIFSSEKIEGGDQVGNYYLKGDFFQSSGHWFFFKKSLYEIDKSMEAYFGEYLLDSEAFVTARKGDFALFDYNSNDGSIFFASDKLGKENLFFVQGEKFLITNSFWEGVSVLKPSEDDIDWLGVKELIIQGIIPFHRTIIKGYDIVKPAQTAFVVKENNCHNIQFTTYWKMKYIPCESTIPETAEKVYKLFDHTFGLLAEKYGSDTKFGVGLSGGWDSRLVVYFAQKYNLKLVPYCIGEKYLVFPIKTNGYKVVNRLAKFFGLDNFKFIPYDKETYLKKIAREVALIPDMSSNIEIGCMESLPDFDVMLGGIHGGVFFGEFGFEPLLMYKKEDFADCLLNLLTFDKNQEMIMTDSDKAVLKKKTQEYIDSLETDKRFEIYYHYFFDIKASKCKKGFFESMYGTKEIYSMFLDPDFIDEYLTWDPLFLIDRSLQRYFFKKYMPELSKIPDETTDAPLYWRDSSIRNVPRRFLYGIINYIFKSSLRRAKWLSRDREFKCLVGKVVEANEELLKRRFPQLDVERFYRNNPRATANLIKVLMVIDVMQNGNEDIEKYIISKYC